jgi:hypothetical protein
LFLDHVVVTRKHRLTAVFTHHLDAVFSPAIGCMPWVLLAARGIIDNRTGLAGVSFAMATQLGHLDMATHWWLKQQPSPPGRCLTKGWLFAALPGLVWLLPDYRALAAPVAVALVTTALGIAVFRPYRWQVSRHPTQLWVIRGVVSLLTSLPAIMLEK